MNPMGSWLRLSGKTAIITGAASGIGQCIARSLFAQGCNVVLADITQPSLSTNSSRDNVFHSMTCDVSDSSQVRHLIRVADDIAAEHAEDDDSAQFASILVNSAGITRDALISRMTQDEFDKVISVNLLGTWLTCRHFADQSRLESLSHPSSIINIGSVVGKKGSIGQTNYAASKGGVVSLTYSLARELARYGVRANAILPGFIDTPMARAVPEKVKEKMRGRIIMGRFGTVENIADLALFLASERSGYITGEAIECSGMITL